MKMLYITTKQLSVFIVNLFSRQYNRRKSKVKGFLTRIYKETFMDLSLT